jgi:hypothetical protein
VSDQGILRRTLKGALLVVSKTIPIPRVVVFQYNPANLRRRLAPQLMGGDAQGRSSVIMYTGAPTETIDVDVEVDAADQDSFAAAASGSLGLQPQLAAIEIMLYPGSVMVALNTALLAAGTIEIGPYPAPTVLFVWGTQRIVPVKITSYSVTEEAFDAELNPIRASISLSMQVLSYSDVSPDDPAFPLFMAYQVTKEGQAASGYAGAMVDSIRNIIGITPSSY